MLADARDAGDAEIALLTLDRLARLRSSPALAAEADALLPAARHLITDADRVDRLPPPPAYPRRPNDPPPAYPRRQADPPPGDPLPG
ncbi:hypothetical protein [Actinoplanes subglobosus]|uniref:Uncharacterized protein n=1 Tax=Actinoplanes subglobosus TaxID=1547892 RepID=A0ABV8INZ2_9ACTN